ncbi:RsmF rRNA methyltransferase first C-terminal domain-containing protein [Sporolactobacillus kofuensis]|uniref:RsmF rRNA methyltransferase first C-terminal domain-containing protein n=1 Tax=Sporolactobacillus kofuensis TaxID=269672 RepID=A0ABW1WFB0_9BACL|nr:RsmF rRNA methyltransferase first C-terminal domain-containing protein [Sporolactobacillus kofuensis]MCO7175322.1 RsmF rRNA methyltransferase first C-terminal domain-containing protein [Sporolactobacillus kofuensis]
MLSLPEAFRTKITTMMGAEEAALFFETYQQNRAVGLRVNPLKVTGEQLMERPEFHLQPIPFCQTGYYYEEHDLPGKHPFHQAGLYYIQEPSAMFVAETLGAEPGDHVLDLCAAPGGKSTQIAASMQNSGLLISNEPYPKRAKALSENIERMGITNTVVTNETPERLAHYFPGYFDKILVDAPCSGEGMFRKDPDAMQYWSPDHVADCARLQAQILDQAYLMLRSGGVLVYSTCTFSPEEDEQMIEQLLEKYPDLELLPIEKSFGVADGRPQWTRSKQDELSKTARLWPHHLQGEGHFVAKLLKKSETESRRNKTAVSAKPSELSDFQQFEKAVLAKKLDGIFHFSGNQLFLLPFDCPDFGKLKVIRFGLHLGEQKKNRFEPNHALALALPSSAFQQQLALHYTENQWDSYLRGETLPLTDNIKGWTVVTIDGFPLGWGKAAGGILKNFYPKGLRRRGLK